MERNFSIIVPVYNRPEELRELLESLSLQTFKNPFEMLVIEDGSTISSKAVVERFAAMLNISYYVKDNTGPGASRNFGMQKAKGDYFIFIDSDCILPPQYLKEIDEALKKEAADCFGGPDTAHTSFSKIQKAINYAMTSFLTTGGIRGHRRSAVAFQPRSFNMGISKKAFEKTGGFGKIHPGEDPELSIRLKKNEFKILFIEKAFVYHKRRISWKKFYQQLYKFGLARAILNQWYPETQKITYWFPILFWAGQLLAIALFFLEVKFLLYVYALFFLAVFIEAFIKNRDFTVAFLAIYAVLIQFFAYGKGFITSTFWVKMLHKAPEKAFPTLFFLNNKH
jgi:glycosyltransferase involved in cell wall biosynthesis